MDYFIQINRKRGLWPADGGGIIRAGGEGGYLLAKMINFTCIPEQLSNHHKLILVFESFYMIHNS